MWFIISELFVEVFHATLRVVHYSQIDSVGVSGDKKGLHWYQWFDTHKETPLMLVVIRRVSIGINGTIAITRK